MAAVCNALRKGGYRASAAAFSGVTYETLRRWCMRGREGLEPYATFYAAVKAAEAQGEQALAAKRALEEAARIKLRQAIAFLNKNDRVKVDAKVATSVEGEDPDTKIARLESVIAAIRSARKEEE